MYDNFFEKEKKMIAVIKKPFYILTIVLLCGTAISSRSFNDFIYPDEEIIESIVQMNDDKLTNALYLVLDSITELGGENILVCRFHRIEAPLSGYLIDGLFKIELEGEKYSTFRVVIEDSTEDRLFALIARGMDSDSNIIWYPEPGPDYIPEDNQVIPEDFLIYEFLIDRDEFENLENEFPLPETINSGE